LFKKTFHMIDQVEMDKLRRKKIVPHRRLRKIFD